MVLQVGIAFVDKDYPARAAFGIVTRVLDEYSDKSRDAWRAATADTNDAIPMLEAAVSKYQASDAQEETFSAPLVNRVDKQAGMLHEHHRSMHEADLSLLLYIITLHPSDMKVLLKGKQAFAVLQSMRHEKNMMGQPIALADSSAHRSAWQAQLAIGWGG